MVGVLNTVLSLFYYLRVVRVMVFSPEPLYRDAPTIPLDFDGRLVLRVADAARGGVVLPARAGCWTWAKAAASALFY